MKKQFVTQRTAGASPQDYGNLKTRALKARFTLGCIRIHLQLNRAFSARVRGDLYSWGDAPGSFEIAPLALNKKLNQRTQSIGCAARAIAPSSPHANGEGDIRRRLFLGSRRNFP